MQHKKILFAAAVMMASVVMFTGCASQEIQDRKAASEAAAIAAAQPTATPAPTPAPTPEPINAWSLLDNLPEFAVGTLDKPDMTWTDGLPLGVNPLTYEDGAFVSGLYSSASGSSTQIKSVSVKDLNEMPISGYLKLSVLETGETVIDSIEDAVTGEGLEKISRISVSVPRVRMGNPPTTTRLASMVVRYRMSWTAPRLLLTA